MMKNFLISKKTLSRIEGVLIILMLVQCFSWGFFNINRITVILAIMMFLLQQMIKRMLENTKDDEVNIVKELSKIFSRSDKEHKNREKIAAVGNVYYPKQFMSQGQKNHFDRK